MNGNRMLLFLLLILFLLTPASAVASVIDDDADAIIARFQEYLRINTAHPSPDYDTSARFLLAQSASIGLHAETVEFAAGKPLVLLSWPGRLPSLPSLLLNSHTDVVPAEPHKWRYPPFSASTDSDGKIFARGSQDMKCVGLQYIEAIRHLKAKGFTPDRTIYVSFVPDEEIGGHEGAEAFAKSEKFRSLNVGVVFDEGLASPSEDYRVFYAERSPWWMTIKARGAPGHGALMYDGSAMENLAKSLEVIRKFRASQFDLVKAGRKAEGEVVSVNMVFLKAGTPSSTSRTGFVMNIQPSEAEAGFDIRVPPNADPRALERRIAEEWAPSSRNLTFEFIQKVPVHDMFGNPAITTADSSNPWWTLLVDAVQKANGRLAKPEIFPASTDVRYFRARGIPAFGFSPMANTPILLHDHNEFLNKAEYLKGIAIYESIIKEFTTYRELVLDDESRAEL
ncbi:aminoacylase-1 isoform X2 [Phalaenopsis equestris]|uniref:aminoacylase-1 isoform X2 n=1 Tax=Phalaenopsis equestris TaxID=78828 RepID=UPI0009E3492E|nr:aminoacylase-1 isoform X2 [Phalaenopsis equestris]